MRRVKVQEKEKEREASFVAAETTVFVSQQHGGQGPPMSRKQKTRGTSVYRRVCAAVEQESDSGALQEEGYKHTVLPRAHGHAQWKQKDYGWYHLQ